MPPASSLSGRRLLLLTTTTGYQTQAFVEAAQKLGVAVVFGTDRCHVLEDPWRDGAVPLRFHKPEDSAKAIVEHAASSRVDGIVAVGDAPTITAALACRELGLPFHPAEAAAACHNKLRSRQLLQAAGLQVPFFACLPADLEPPAPPDGLPFPCVLKPVSLSASRGVIRADHPQQFIEAFRRIAALLRSPEIQVKKEEITDSILVEGFIEGREFAMEGLMDHGRLLVLALFDKPDPLDGPYFEETIYVTPSRLDRETQSSIVRSVDRAVHALGLCHGPIHAELRLNESDPWILEVAARPIGGLCARALRFGSGLPLEELIIRHALGMEVAGLDREDAASGVMMIPVPKEGILEEVRGLEEALKTPGVEEITVTAKLRQKLIPWPEGASYLGFIFARAGSPEEVEDVLRRAHQRLEFVILPSLPVR